MLLQRLLTALVLVPLVVALVLLAPTPFVALATGVVVLLGALEWARLSGLDNMLGRSLYMILTTLLMVAAEWLRREHGANGIYLVAALWWLLLLGFLVQLRRKESSEERGFSFQTALAGQLVLAPAWVAMADLHGRQPDGPYLLLFLMVMIWLADSGAYFAGRRWGRTKLAPTISPGKTWEGVLGAMAAMIMAGLLLYLWAPLPGQGLVSILLLCLVTGLFSIVGDLFQSLIKRRRGVKDSGSLLPGHGGVLDRIDSLTAAAPLFMFGLMAMGAL